MDARPLRGTMGWAAEITNPNPYYLIYHYGGNQAARRAQANERGCAEDRSCIVQEITLTIKIAADPTSSIL